MGFGYCSFSPCFRTHAGGHKEVAWYHTTFSTINSGETLDVTYSMAEDPCAEELAVRGAKSEMGQKASQEIAVSRVRHTLWIRAVYALGLIVLYTDYNAGSRCAKRAEVVRLVNLPSRRVNSSAGSCHDGTLMIAIVASTESSSNGNASVPATLVGAM